MLVSRHGFEPPQRDSKTRVLPLDERGANGSGPRIRTSINWFRASRPAIERARINLEPTGWNRTAVGALQVRCPATERCRQNGVTYGYRARHTAFTARPLRLLGHV